MSLIDLTTGRREIVPENTHLAAVGMTCGEIDNGCWGGVDDVAGSVAVLRKLLAPLLTFDPECAVELLIVPRVGCSVAHHFRADQPEEIVMTAAVHGRGQRGCTIGLSPIPSGLGRPAKPDDVLHHFYLPVSVIGSSRKWASQSPNWASREAIALVAKSIAANLRLAHGFPRPVVINGDSVANLYSVNVSKNDGGIIGEFTAATYGKFSTTKAMIDLNTDDALMGRIPLPWSRECKGRFSTPARPWMTTTVDLGNSPDVAEVVPTSLLRKIADRRWNELKRETYEVSPWGNASAWRASESSWQKGGAV